MRNFTPWNADRSRPGPRLMRLEDRFAPGSVFGDALAAAIPAQIASLTSQTTDAIPPSSSLTLINMPPATAAPAVDPGVTLYTSPAVTGAALAVVASALMQPNNVPAAPSVGDELFANFTPATPLAPMPTVPDPAPQSGGGAAVSLATVPTAPPATGTPQTPPTPPPVIPPPNTNPPALPHANADSYIVTGGALVVSAASGLQENDTNPTGEPMTVQLVDPPAFGTVSVGTDGSFAYAANAGMNVGSFTDTFTYEDVTAGGLPSNTATVILTVGGTGGGGTNGGGGGIGFGGGGTGGGGITGTSPPTANNDYYTVYGGTLFVSANGVLANDTAPAGETMTPSLVGAASHGTATLGSTGSVNYVADAGYSGTDSFTYDVSAGGLSSNIATVTLTVNASNNGGGGGGGGGGTTGGTTTLMNPGSQSSAEGESVSLALQATVTGGTPTYAAVDLPTGLGINSTSGVISGTVDYAAAENDGGIYASIVIVTGAGGSATTHFTWTVTVKDTPRPPVLVNPGDQANNTGEPLSLQLSGSSPDGTSLAYSAVGLPSGLTVDSSGAITGSIAHSANLSNPVMVTATDTVSGLTASQMFNWGVTPTSHAPTLDPIADQTNSAGDVVDVPVNGNSADGSTLTYSMTGQPSGVGIDAITGEITGTIANTAYGAIPYQATVTVSDGTSSASQTFAWKVGAVLLTNPGDQTNAIGDAVALPVVAQNFSGGTLSYSAAGLPHGLTINQITGVIGGTVAAGAVWQGDFTVTVTATNGTDSASQTFDWTVTAASNTTAPMIADPGPQTNTAGDTVSLQIHASSPNGALTYSATGLPANLAIDQAGTITGTLTAEDVGTTSVTVTVVDPLGGTASDTFSWTVTPTTHAPTLDPIADQTNSAGDVVDVPVYGNSVDGSPLTYSITGQPGGVGINPASGDITGTITNTAYGAIPYQVTVTVSDGTSSASQSFAWKVGAVLLTKPGDQTNAIGDAVSLPVIAQDVSGWTLSYSVTGLPNGLAIDQFTGVIGGTVIPGAAWQGDFTVTVTATNGTDSASRTFDWAVTAASNVTAPTITDPGTQTNTSGDTVSLPIQASSPNGALLYSVTGLPGNLTLDPVTGKITGTLASSDVGTSSVTVTVTDPLGGSASDTFTWAVTPSAETASVGGYVWIDSNADGLQGANESGMPGVTVELFDVTHTLVGTTTTDAGGRYQFAGVQANASYQLVVVAPQGYVPTAQNVGLPGQASAIDAFGSTGTFLVGAAGTGTTLDAGFVRATTTGPSLLTGSAGPILAEAGAPFSGTVAGFQSSDLGSTVASYSATIDWGDGTAPTTGTVAANATPGSFAVQGTHTYATGGTYRATVTVMNGLIPALVLPLLALVAPPVRSLRVTALSFGGGYQFSGRDIGTTPYDGSKQWDASTGSVPYAYVRNAKLTVSKVTFQVVDPTVTGTVSIKGTIWDYTAGRAPRKLGTVQKANVQIANGTVQATNLVSNNALSKDVTYFDKLAIVWSVTLPDGTTGSAGVTSTRVYVLFAKPTGDLVTAAGKSQFFLPTMADVGCRAAEDYNAATGAYPQTEKQMLDAIWAKFETRSIQRAQDGKVLQYYGTWKTPTKIGTTNKASLDLIRKANGECTDWAVFLLATMGAQGITGKDSTVPARFSVIEPTNPLEVKRGGIMINGWTFAGKAGPGKYPYTNVVTKLANGTTPGDQKKADGNRQYRFSKTSPVTYDAPLPGQGQIDPPSLFKNHLVVRVKIGGVDQLYDPSYGVQYPSLQDFQNRAIAGFYIMQPKDDGSGIMGIRRNVAGAALGVRFTTK